MNEQPSAWWYAMMAVWSLIAIAIVAYVWIQVGRQDRKIAAEEAQRAEDDKLWGEMWDAMEADRTKGKTPTEDYSAFLLDDDNQPKSANYEKAKRLGFVDEKPRPAA